MPIVWERIDNISIIKYKNIIYKKNVFSWRIFKKSKNRKKL